MNLRIFKGADPFVQLIFLFLLSFFSVGIFLLISQGLISLLWGVDLFNNPAIMQDYTNPQVVNINRVLLTFQHLGLFIVPALIFVQLISDRPKHYLLIDSPPSSTFVGMAFILMIVAMAPVNYLAYLNEDISFPAALEGLEESMRLMEDQAKVLTEALIYVDSFGMLLVNIVIIALLPAIGEELIFRGLIMKILIRWTKKMHLGIWISAFLFSFMHFQFFGFLPRFLLGLLLGYLVVWSGSLIPAMIAHFFNNAVALIMAYMVKQQKLDSSAETMGANDIVMVAIGIFLFILLFWWISKKSKWREIEQDYLYGV